MSSARPETPDRQPPSVSRTQEVTVRRAPNLLAFVATGAAVGALVGLLVGALGPGSIAYTRAAIIGFFLMMFLILGATLGAVVGLLLDRVSLKRSRNASAEVEDVHEGGHRTHS
ncbi:MULTISPECIES: DUF2273 domain-containing protein [Kocuria]|uniref:DUF2273 domain-containing protein n=1 Tax=Kocuria TaxID=57493 RepID=UPI0008A150D7|nr:MULTISPECIES: DUF2273 domain-containing protein [Kocuria]OFK06403.1 hypothetical protein HMPREF2833_05695 [Kocuria sp. HMSC066H03]PKZ38405.1 hypothetical protein CYJ75_04450 [Kocuria rhizophila]